MTPLSQMPDRIKQTIRYVLTDIDDTLTVGGRLVGDAFVSMERLQQAGISVVPITGRPAGWCDHIARMWPVDALVGENGAFYFRYAADTRKMTRRYFKTEPEREKDKIALAALKQQILAAVPEAAVSADQLYREADLAIDFCEDVPRLPREKIDRITACFVKAGASAKVSSIHVNGWFGDYDKLTMTRCLFSEAFDAALDAVKKNVLYIGDSPNDAPMFAYFENSVGVANVIEFLDVIDTPPAWITQKPGGHGFAEMVSILLAAR